MKNEGITRLLSIKEAAAYMGLGINNARKLMDDIGATVHIGKRVLADRQILDRYIDEVRETNGSAAENSR